MSRISKYAVPFNTRKSTSNCNVVNKVVLGGVGYLKIKLPVNPSFENCIGFKVKVTSEDGNLLLFEGHISGSSSDGYSWIYASSTAGDKTGDHLITGKPTLFCAQYIDESKGNVVGNVVRSILIGDKDTNWGSVVHVSIECLQATLKTAPDGEDNIRTTANINEYSALSEKLDESNENSRLTDGWLFEVGQLSGETPIISLGDSDSGEIKSSLSIDGVVEGVAKEENGATVITTRYTGNRISLYNEIDGVYGFILADGSQLVNLDKNESILNMEVKSNGFKSPIEIRSTDDSDVYLRFTIQNSGELITPRLEVNKITEGDWNPDNEKYLSVKTSNIIGELSPVFKHFLKAGELGCIHNDDNTDLYLGTGDSNNLVGGIKICNDVKEFSHLDLVKGRMAIIENEIYACDGEKWIPVKFSELLSLDEVMDGYFYEKTNADAILGGEVIRLKHDLGLITGNEIYDHIHDMGMHVTQADKDRWDAKTDLSDYYNKGETDDLLDRKADKDHYHGYHSPINIIVEGNTDLTTHNYPYGHRVLVKEFEDNPPIIKIAGNPNDWIGSEDFNLGDKTTIAAGRYVEYMNKAGKVVISNSDINRGVYVQVEYREPVSADVDNLKDGDWFINKGGYVYETN